MYLHSVHQFYVEDSSGSYKTVRKSIERLNHVGGLSVVEYDNYVDVSLVCHVSDVTSKLLEMSRTGSNVVLRIHA